MSTPTPGPAADLALRSRRVITHEGERAGVVLVRDGRIAGVVDAGGVPAGTPIEDLGDAVLMPGLVDSHVHVNEPGRTEWEGFESATRAAAAGGVTTLVDMPLNSIPVTTSRDALEAQARGRRRGTVSWTAASGAASFPATPASWTSLLDAGACGVQGVPCATPGSTTSPRRARPSCARRCRSWPSAASRCSSTPSWRRTLGPPHGDPRRYATYLASRPPSWEREAVALLLAAVPRAARADPRRPSLRRVRGPARGRGAARGPADDRRDLPALPGARGRGRRGRAHRVQVRAAGARARRTATRSGTRSRDGTIGLVVSDHSPCPPALKEPERGDFMAAWGGIASLQLALPVVWTEARRRGLRTRTARRAGWPRRPARLAGLAARKGRIAPGYDADLVGLRPRRELRGRRCGRSTTATSSRRTWARTLHGVVAQDLARAAARSSTAGSFEGAPRGALLSVSA